MLRKCDFDSHIPSRAQDEHELKLAGYKKWPPSGAARSTQGIRMRFNRSVWITRLRLQAKCSALFGFIYCCRRIDRTAKLSFKSLRRSKLSPIPTTLPKIRIDSLQIWVILGMGQHWRPTSLKRDYFLGFVTSSGKHFGSRQ